MSRSPTQTRIEQVHTAIRKSGGKGAAQLHGVYPDVAELLDSRGLNVYIQPPAVVRGSVLDGKATQTAQRVPHIPLAAYAQQGVAVAPVYVYTQTLLGDLSPGQVVTAPLQQLRDAMRKQELKCSPIAQGDGVFTVQIVE